ncbi:nucleoside hydrolase [Microthyrium microscopicum]|uniref:Nucleoside hydrolase n=1 Tax=Microthyrium microscopicum TaxID=703497 RepID=A0A6A6U639_9PEZI|nr:nucleoside hydrolase [Microthyrium microscopicum]
MDQGLASREISELAARLWNPSPSAEEEIPVWLDCDTGHDDAFAILLLAQCPRFKLLGISTVHGNSSLENTTRNSLSVLEAIGRRDIPVYPGAAKPFCREVAHAESIHGESGLDGTTVLPTPKATACSHPNGAIGAIHAALTAYPGKAWLISTGALTNIGLLFAVYPDLAESIAGLSIMGGAIGGFFSHAPCGRLSERLELARTLHKEFPGGLPDDSNMTIPEVAKHFKELGILKPPDDMDDERVHFLLDQARSSFGNWSPYAEFNIYCDPEAASAVFQNPILAPKTTLIPLDLTHQVLANEEVVKLLQYGSKEPSSKQDVTMVRKLFNEILTYFASTYANEFNMCSGPPLHDPLTAAIILAPEIFHDGDGERFSVHVVTAGDENLTGGPRHNGRDIGQCGRTICHMLPKGSKGIRIPRTLDVNVFWHLLNKSLERAEGEA